MANRMQYVTHQRKDMLDYFQSVEGKHVTAADICECFRQSGKKIGMTTVYRHLEKMVDEGIVKKYIIDGNSPACFEYVGGGEACQDPVCFHCKCEKCGKLIHLHCDELEDIRVHLEQEHHFKMDPLRTVESHKMFGTSSFCAERDAYGILRIMRGMYAAGARMNRCRGRS